MTNREKFKEVFGYLPNHDTCIIPDTIRCPTANCEECPYDNWWDDQYTGRFEDGSTKK